MQITRLMVAENKYNVKCPYEMNPDGICVHNTANKASAMAEVSYMVGNGNTVSYHYAIDDYRIVQGVEENRNTWHSGDGRNGKGNRNKISIEICHSTNPDPSIFDAAEKLAAKFIAYKLKEKGWGIERVSKHQDYSGKYCPHRTLDLGWERFLNLIRAELGQAQQITPAQNKNSSMKIVAIKSVSIIQSTLNERYGLNIAVDNIFGKETKKALAKALQIELNKQYDAGLDVDGIFGNITYSKCRSVRNGSQGNITWILQALLKCKGYSLSVDGIFGNETLRVLKQYQMNKGLVVDGIAGRNTFRSLLA